MYIILKKDRFNLYAYYKADTIEMNILGSLLSSDILSRTSSFKEWFYRPEEVLSGNTILLEKEDNYIVLSDLYDEYPPKNYIKLTRDQFIYILDTWEKLYKESPDEIIITKENDKITMLGKNNLENKKHA